MSRCVFAVHCTHVCQACILHGSDIYSNVLPDRRGLLCCFDILPNELCVTRVTLKSNLDKTIDRVAGGVKREFNVLSRQPSAIRSFVRSFGHLRLFSPSSPSFLPLEPLRTQTRGVFLRSVSHSLSIRGASVDRRVRACMLSLFLSTHK